MRRLNPQQARADSVASWRLVPWRLAELAVPCSASCRFNAMLFDDRGQLGRLREGGELVQLICKHEAGQESRARNVRPLCSPSTSWLAWLNVPPTEGGQCAAPTSRSGAGAKNNDSCTNNQQVAPP